MLRGPAPPTSSAHLKTLALGHRTRLTARRGLAPHPLFEELLDRQPRRNSVVMQLATLLASHPERHMRFPSDAAMNRWHDHSLAGRASGVPNVEGLGVSPPGLLDDVDQPVELDRPAQELAAVGTPRAKLGPARASCPGRHSDSRPAPTPPRPRSWPKLAGRPAGADMLQTQAAGHTPSSKG